MNQLENRTAKRRGKNLTREQLVERIGIPNKAISKWENGEMYAQLCYC